MCARAWLCVRASVTFIATLLSKHILEIHDENTVKDEASLIATSEHIRFNQHKFTLATIVLTSFHANGGPQSIMTFFPTCLWVGKGRKDNMKVRE